MTKIVRKLNLLLLLKMGVGSAIAIILADRLGFLFSPSAGIITLLTIQNTKRETIKVAAKRFGAFALAVLLSYMLFPTVGYTPAAFGIFVVFFVALCFLLAWKEAIAMNAVLMTHFLVEERMDASLLFNEIGILIIGMGIGIVFNLVMPKYKEVIQREQKSLEEEIKTSLYSLSRLLLEKDACLLQDGSVTYSYEQEISSKTVDFEHINHRLEQLLRKAYEEAGNTILSDTRYLISYLEMRKLQIGVLMEVKEHMDSIPVILMQSISMSKFIEHIAGSFHERNNVAGLMKELEILKQHFREDELPRTREEFEYRAVLFHILKELEYFLILKRNFIQELETKNMNSYWK